MQHGRGLCSLECFLVASAVETDALLLLRMLYSIYFFLFSFLFYFPAKICAHFSSLGTSAIELKYEHSVQNGLSLWSITFWAIWSTALEVLIHQTFLTVSTNSSKLFIALSLQAYDAMTSTKFCCCIGMFLSGNPTFPAQKL